MSQSNARQEHSQRFVESHEKILAAAAKLMRERGIDGASVNDVMSAAGLTRGGFYAHFSDKEQLVAETVAGMFVDARYKLVGQFKEKGEAWVEQAARYYLSGFHLRAIHEGCVIPTLGGEIARCSLRVREAFSAGRRELLADMAAKLGGERADEAALSFLSTCVGALAVARAEAEPRAADRILESARIALLRTMAPRLARSTRTSVVSSRS